MFEFSERDKTDYLFEGSKYRQVDISDFSLDREAGKFVQRLRLPPVPSDADSDADDTWTPQYRRMVWDFVNRVHRNIYWYTVARRREVTWYRIYMVLTVVAVIAVPLIAVLIPSAHVNGLLANNGIDSRSIPTSAMVSAQLTNVIAGVYGVHRLASSWLFRRNHAHAFWKAAANLKDLLYGIEEKWARKAKLATGSLDLNFLLELEQAKVRVREIMAEEEEAFFKSYASIKTDLQSTVSASITGASGVVSKVSQPILKRAVEEEKRRGENKAAVVKARGEVVRLRAQKIGHARYMAINEAKAKLLKAGPARDTALKSVANNKVVLASVENQLVAARAEYRRAAAAMTF